jgi:hypothetical protein
MNFIIIPPVSVSLSLFSLNDSIDDTHINIFSFASHCINTLLVTE